MHSDIRRGQVGTPCFLEPCREALYATWRRTPTPLGLLPLPLFLGDPR